MNSMIFIAGLLHNSFRAMTEKEILQNIINGDFKTLAKTISKIENKNLDVNNEPGQEEEKKHETKDDDNNNTFKQFFDKEIKLPQYYDLFEKEGLFRMINGEYVEKETINRAKELYVDRRFLQAKFIRITN